MKKRLGTVLLLALFVISSMMPTSAATAEIWNEARASHYFDAYMLGISAKGGGEMAVSFGVFGTDTMDKIGVYSLRIESGSGRISFAKRQRDMVCRCLVE